MSSPLGLHSFVGGAPPTTLSEDCGADDTTLNINAVVLENWPNPATVGPFQSTLDRGVSGLQEDVLVTALTTTQATVVRGYAGTSAQGHDAGANFVHTIDAPAMQDVDYHVYDTTRDDHTQYAKALTDGYGITGAGRGTSEPAVDLTILSSYISGNVTCGTNSIEEVTSLALAEGTWRITSRLYLENQSSTSHNFVDAFIGTTSGSATGAIEGVSYDLPQSATATGTGQPVDFTVDVVVASPTTYYLNVAASSNGSVVVNHVTIVTALPNASGMKAMRIA